MLNLEEYKKYREENLNKVKEEKEIQRGIEIEQIKTVLERVDKVIKESLKENPEKEEILNIPIEHKELLNIDDIIISNVFKDYGFIKVCETYILKYIKSLGITVDFTTKTEKRPGALPTFILIINTKQFIDKED